MPDNPLWPVHRQGMRLREVTADLSSWPSHTAFEALILRFDADPAEIDPDEPEGPTAAAVAFVADNSDDSLVLCEASEWQPDPDLVHVSMTDEEPWCAAVGKPIIWSWSMVNQQGYRDGYQLEFAENVSDTEIVVQLLVLGGVQVRRVDHKFLRPPPRPQ